MTFTLRLAAALAVLIPTGLQAEFTLEGRVAPQQGSQPARLYRENIDARTQSLAAEFAIGADGAFRARVEGEAGFFTLRLPGDVSVSLAIADDQTVRLEAEPEAFQGFRVEGSPDSEDLRAYERFRQASLERLVYPPRNDMRAARDSGSPPSRLAELTEREVEATAAHRRELNDFVIDKMDTSIALYATSLRWDGDHRLDELAKRVDAFEARFPGLAIGEAMQARLHRFRSLALGAIAPPLAGKDLDGTERALEDLRGGYALVDFWAAWCSPCRIENLRYPKIREVFGPRGFEVFAVNLDASRAQWETAARRDGIDWPQISDLQGWGSPLAAAYNVTSLPASYLLDPEGRIVAKNLRGKALEAELARLLAAKR